MWENSISGDPQNVRFPVSLLPRWRRYKMATQIEVEDDLAKKFNEEEVKKAKKVAYPIPEWLENKITQQQYNSILFDYSRGAPIKDLVLLAGIEVEDIPQAHRDTAQAWRNITMAKGLYKKASAWGNKAAFELWDTRYKEINTTTTSGGWSGE